MRILVTGGAGYVGSTLVQLLLASGHEVRVVDSLLHGGESLLSCWSHPAFDFLRGDLRINRISREAVVGAQAVVHLAAIVGDPACARQPDIARAVNLEASLSLLEESRRAGVQRFVFASTCSNYGKMKDESSYVDENSELCPVSLYAETKVAVERALLCTSEHTDWCPTPLRFATIYGVSPRMRFDLTVNEFTLELLVKGKLIVFGEQFWRPYVHVRDAARAILLVLDSPCDKVRHRVFNVGDTTQNFQKKQLVDLIRPLAPEALVEYVLRKDDPRDYRVSFARIQKELGFSVTKTVPDGITEIAHLVRDRIIRNFELPAFKN